MLYEETCFCGCGSCVRLRRRGDLHGVQLGILNFSGSGGAIVFPILNLGF